LEEANIDWPEFDTRISKVMQVLPENLRHTDVNVLIKLSLVEDLQLRKGRSISDGDVTSIATINQASLLEGRVSAKASGIQAGLPLAEIIFEIIDPNIKFIAHKVEGVALVDGDLIASVSGAGPSLLAAERVALNFLGRMSGVATMTRKYVDAIAGTQAVILDTRKTTPGWRRLDKYAVRVGGGQNHRQGLYDMVLIKDNHIDGAGGITKAVDRVRQQYDNKYPIEVEVKDLIELEEALSLNPERILLDNMSIETMQRAVDITAGRVPLEASGNVSLESVHAIAETGVDLISVGALTHSAPVLDISMRLAGSRLQ